MHANINQRRPGWIGSCGIVAIRVSGVNGFARSPEVVGVFGVHHGDRGVLDGNIEQGEQAGIFQQTVMMGGGSDARNVVADNLHVRHPEERRFGLIRCACRAVESADAFHLVVIRRVSFAAQCGRTFSAELRAAFQCKRRDIAPGDK